MRNWQLDGAGGDQSGKIMQACFCNRDKECTYTLSETSIKHNSTASYLIPKFRRNTKTCLVSKNTF
jgi:hypothetical protein